MKKFEWVPSSLIFLLLIIFILMPQATLSGQSGSPASPMQGAVLVTNNLNLDFSKHKVTFIELGADRCIPCKAMQPIMKEIAEEYAGKIQVVFYDVWKDPAPARKYGIQLIPTQVFIDQSGKEVFRHVGFFDKEEMLSMLKEKSIL
jgi:thioredoxin 1